MTTMLDAPLVSSRRLTVRELAQEAFALVIGWYIHDLPDAKFVEVTDDKGDPLPSDLQSAIVRCTLVFDHVIYRGTVWVNTCGKTKAKLSYASSTMRHRTRFVFSQYESATVREDYIRWHRGE